MKPIDLSEYFGDQSSGGASGTSSLSQDDRVTFSYNGFFGFVAADVLKAVLSFISGKKKTSE